MVEEIKKHITKIDEKLPELLDRYRKYYASNTRYKNIGKALRYLQISKYDFLSAMQSSGEIIDLEEKFGVFVAQIDRFLKGSGLEDFDKSSLELMNFITSLENKYSQNAESKVEKLARIAEASEADSDLADKLNILEEQIKNLQSSEYQMETQKQLHQAKSLFDDASKSQSKIEAILEKVEQEKDLAIAELRDAKEGQIAYVLAEQFEKKAISLKEYVNKHQNWMTAYVALLLIYATVFLFFYLLGRDLSSYTFFFLAVAMKLPIIFMVFFHLNEYGKAKKLYEEYENKRIMAATLVNSLNRIKAELQVDTKELIEIIKTPMERIFDNPVHSIYGDKSGDKNSMKDMLEQFDKLSSIVDKMKKPN